MTPFTFSPKADDWLLYEGVRMRVVGASPDRIVLERPTGEELDIPRSRILELYRTGAISRIVSDDATGGGVNEEAIAQHVAKALDGFSKQATRAATYAARYLDELAQRSVKTSSVSAALIDGIDRVAQDIGDLHPPSPHSVVSWARRRQEASNGFMGCLPRYDKRGGAGRRRMNPIVWEALQDAIDTYFLCQPPSTRDFVQEKLEKSIVALNALRPAADQLRVPSKATVYRVIQDIPKYDVVCAQRGRDAADAMFRWSGTKDAVRRILDEVQIDHTIADIILVDENGKPIGRPTLTAVLDSHSRVVLGLYVGFEHASWRSVMRALTHAILPKPISLPEVDRENPWPFYGIMSSAKLDNGKDFLSMPMQVSGIELGILLAFCARKRPWGKPYVERFFRFLNTAVVHHLPGTTFSNPHERGNYKPKKEARLTLEQFRVIVQKWIVEVYHHRVHRILGVSPEQAWQRSAEASPPRLPASAWMVRVALGIPERCRIDHAGLTLHVDQKYNGEYLAAVRRQFGAEIEAEVKYFPEDLGSIAVRDPIKNVYVEVFNVDPAYSRGLSLAQHQLNRKRGLSGSKVLAASAPRNLDVPAAVARADAETAIARRRKAALDASAEPVEAVSRGKAARTAAERGIDQLRQTVDALIRDQERSDSDEKEKAHA